MRRVCLIALAALLAGCGSGASDSLTDPLAAARAAIINRNFADAEDYARKAVSEHPDNPDAHFELARAEALRANSGNAEDELGKALDKGLADPAQKLRDPSFDGIRNDERFAQLVERASPTAASNPHDKGNQPTVEIGDDQVRAGDVVLNTDF